jgi:hypothetical protein
MTSSHSRVVGKKSGIVDVPPAGTRHGAIADFAGAGPICLLQG